MSNPSYLVRSGNGRVFAFDPILARRADMTGAVDLDEAQSLSRERGGDPLSFPSPAPTDDDNDDFVISTATKDELEAFAQAQFGVDLDKRKSVDHLREQVLTLTRDDS